MPPEDDDALDPLTGLPIAPAVPTPAVPVVPAQPVATPAVVAPVVPTTAQRRSIEEATASDIRAREKKKLLREEYGTDDPDKVAEIKAERQARLDEHARLKETDEANKRAQLSEVERLTADVNRLTSENEKLAAKIKLLETDNVVSKQDAKIRSIAVQYIQPNKLKYAVIDFGEYVRSLTKADQAKMDEIRTTNWFKKFARENPDMALGATPPAVAAKAVVKDDDAEPPKAGTPPVVQRPTARVVPAGRPRPAVPVAAKPAVADPLAGLTPRPGQPNSMNRQQLAQHMKNQGLRPL